jgi:hypothetical protein
MKAARQGSQGKQDMRTWGALICKGDVISAAKFKPFAEAREEFDSILEMLHAAFSGHLLRRTPSSTSRDGTPLIKLPPITFKTVWVTLESNHLEQLKANMDDAILKAVEVDKFGVCHFVTCIFQPY